MEADYSVELGPTAPALEIPWNDPESRWHYVNLRDSNATGRTQECTPEDIAEVIPEARRFPALARFLLAANSVQGAWQTAKCGVSAEETEPAENFYNARFAQSSYVDLVLADTSTALRANFEAHQRLAKELAQRLEANLSLETCGEVVVRRCYFHPDGNVEESDAGFCLTLFLTGYGACPDEALDRWERTLAFAAECLLELKPGEISA